MLKKRYGDSARKVMLAAVAAILCLACIALVGCKSEAVKNAEEKLAEFNQKTVAINSGGDIAVIDRMLGDLSENELNSLEGLEEYQQKKEQFNLIASEAAHKIEKVIDELPEPNEIRLDSEDAIKAARKALDGANSAVSSRVSNAEVLRVAEKKLKEIKEAGWVECNTCYGSGHIKCRICNGTGTKHMDYNAPNGKTFHDIAAECPKTQTCPECKGRGGYYDESLVG